MGDPVSGLLIIGATLTPCLAMLTALVGSSMDWGVRSPQIWTYPDQPGWFRADPSYSFVVLTPVDGGPESAIPREKVHVSALWLRLRGSRVPMSEIEAHHILKGEANDG